MYRALAVAAGGGIPDGLIEGGLKVDSNILTAGWRNAQAPVQTVAGGKTTVTVQQTGDRAILNWETFNVGRNTTVDFRQQAPQRVAHYLLTHCATDGGPASIRLPFQKSLLAGKLGLAPEALSRAFSTLRRAGVTVRGRTIQINDVSALKQI